jgi:enamine deaminase RidA (YjgF/YER057c/UK114 family)
MSVESITPAGWPRGPGYAHGTAASGRVICTAGQVGWDPLTQQIVSADFSRQVDQALGNVVAVLTAAGASAADVVRMTWYITDAAAYDNSRAALGEVWRRHLGRNFPAMSVVVVAGLIEAGALVEIEATAVIPA